MGQAPAKEVGPERRAGRHASGVVPRSGSLDAARAAEMLGAHVETVRRLARRGRIPAFKVGKDWRFARDALQEWMSQPRGDPPPRDATLPPLVLVVDDELDVCRATVRVLERDGLRARFALGGAAAVAELELQKPELVLLDLAMPGLDGPDVLERLRANHPDLPVVIVTGYPDGDLMHRALEFPPLLLLPKPADVEQLRLTVRAALGAARAMREAG